MPSIATRAKQIIANIINKFRPKNKIETEYSKLIKGIEGIKENKIQREEVENIKNLLFEVVNKKDTAEVKEQFEGLNHVLFGEKEDKRIEVVETEKLEEEIPDNLKENTEKYKAFIKNEYEKIFKEEQPRKKFRKVENDISWGIVPEKYRKTGVVPKEVLEKAFDPLYEDDPEIPFLVLGDVQTDEEEEYFCEENIKQINAEKKEIKGTVCDFNNGEDFNCRYCMEKKINEELEKKEESRRELLKRKAEQDLEESSKKRTTYSIFRRYGLDDDFSDLQKKRITFDLDKNEIIEPEVADKGLFDYGKMEDKKDSFVVKKQKEETIPELVSLKEEVKKELKEEIKEELVPDLLPIKEVVEKDIKFELKDQNIFDGGKSIQTQDTTIPFQFASEEDVKTEEVKPKEFIPIKTEGFPINIPVKKEEVKTDFVPLINPFAALKKEPEKSTINLNENLFSFPSMQEKKPEELKFSFPSFQETKPKVEEIKPTAPFGFLSSNQEPIKETWKPSFTPMVSQPQFQPLSQPSEMKDSIFGNKSQDTADFDIFEKKYEQWNLMESNGHRKHRF